MRLSFLEELKAFFQVSLQEDLAIKAKQAGKDGEDNKKKKKAAKDGVVEIIGVQFGKGTRQFFDFLVNSNLLNEEVNEKTVRTFEVAFNKELSSELTEIL